MFRLIVSNIYTLGFTMFESERPNDVKLLDTEEGNKLFMRMLLPEGTRLILPNVHEFSQKSPLFALAIEEIVHPDV